MSDGYDARLGLLIDGEFIVERREIHHVLDPSTAKVVGELPLADPADLDRALDAARRGFAIWRSTTPEVRSAVLYQAARLVQERTPRIAKIATVEQGKPLSEATAETAYAADLIHFYAAEARRPKGRVLARAEGARSMVLGEPVGPSVAFCPWNFPVLNPARKIAPALAAGCSIIVKPAEEAPGSALEVARCFIDAGAPFEALSVVFGVPNQVSKHLILSPIIRKVSFTGSVPVGRQLMRLAADGLKRTTMELGGHAPVIICDDCDLERTVALLTAAKFRNAGQVCVSPTRFYVQEAIYDRFIALFAERSSRLQLGPGLDAGTAMGPLANPRRPEAISGLVEDARKHGARVVTGGEPGEEAKGGGFFFQPTLLAEVGEAARAMNEEPFGPVALARPFRDLDAAVEAANRLPFGLAAYGFTESARRANLLADSLEAGLVGVNMTALSAVDSPFGGVKHSGHGSEDGPEGMDAFLVTKAVHQA